MIMLAYLMPFLCLVAALWRARPVALAIAPSCALILASKANLVDISSASHPLRWVVPAASMSLALLVAWTSSRPKIKAPRTVAASIIVFAAGLPDVLALLAWNLPGTWILVPFQIGVGVGFLGAIFAPERWFGRWINTKKS